MASSIAILMTDAGRQNTAAVQPLIIILPCDDIEFFEFSASEKRLERSNKVKTGSKIVDEQDGKNEQERANKRTYEH
jgi:hypothetical protein